MFGTQTSRRSWLQLAPATLGMAVLCGNQVVAAQTGSGSAQRKSPPFRLGLASYTLRKFPRQEALAMTRQVGLEYICFKDFHLRLDATDEEIAQAREDVAKFGLQLYAGGVITMSRPDQVEQAFSYAKKAGMQLIIGVPHPEVLDLVEKKIQETGVGVAIHNHGPEDRLYPTPYEAYEKVRNRDKRFGLCIDVGHTIRAGVNPAKAARELADRLLDVHVKDVSEAAPKGRTVEIGRGVIDIPEFLTALLEINFSGVVSFEHEKDPDQPLVGLAESVGYVKGVLATLLRA
ncbi:MAG: sugar phosphate isomerase/epimerase [Thermoguttaceae bacterium]|nr:sugar phosphate isomerase/epimerase [Thermoguttaceae bacterium]MDW8078773.1 sugar phosphate isomerase/epimerase family protein [Thermoguttaceae bacterium]